MKTLTVGDVVKLKSGRTKYLIVGIKKEKIFVVSELGTEGYFCAPFISMIILKRKKGIYG